MTPRRKKRGFKQLISVGILCVLLSHVACAYVGADLPPLLEFADGTAVRTTDDWQRRQAEVRGLMLDLFSGTFPEESPRLLDAQIVRQTEKANGVTEQRVTLTFATQHKVTMEICLWIPPGEGPWPVILAAPVDWQVDRKLPVGSGCC